MDVARVTMIHIVETWNEWFDSHPTRLFWDCKSTTFGFLIQRYTIEKIGSMANWNSINDFLILWPRTKYPRFIFDVWSEMIFDFWLVKYQVIRYSIQDYISSDIARDSSQRSQRFTSLNSIKKSIDEGKESLDYSVICIYVSRKSIGFPNGRLILIKQPTEVDDIRMIRKSDYVNASIYFPSSSSSSYYATSLPRKFKTPEMFRNSAQLSFTPEPHMNRTTPKTDSFNYRVILNERRSMETCLIPS